MRVVLKSEIESAADSSSETNNIEQQQLRGAGKHTNSQQQQLLNVRRQKSLVEQETLLTNKQSADDLIAVVVNNQSSSSTRKRSLSPPAVAAMVNERPHYKPCKKKDEDVLDEFARSDGTSDAVSAAVRFRLNSSNTSSSEDMAAQHDPAAAHNQNLVNKQRVNTPLLDNNNNKPSSKSSAFEEALHRNNNLELVIQEGDGNCLFRAVSLQVYGDASMHAEVRIRCMDYMQSEKAHFAKFIDDSENFRDYIRRKRRDGVHGNNPEIQAISELYNRPVEVYNASDDAVATAATSMKKSAAAATTSSSSSSSSSASLLSPLKPMNIFQSDYKTKEIPIRLSYHDGNHYNAVVDPFIPTAGLGLGMPDLHPGLADKLQIKKALDESEMISTDYMYKQKALVMSDLEATDYALEQAVLASSLEESMMMQHKMMNRKCQSSTSRQQQHHSMAASLSSPSFAVSSSSLHAANSKYQQEKQQKSGLKSCDKNDDGVGVGCAGSSPPSKLGSVVDNKIEDEYPPIVQELVMNGFELARVLKARDLVGDNFDDLLAVLMNQC